MLRDFFVCVIVGNLFPARDRNPSVFVSKPDYTKVKVVVQLVHSSLQLQIGAGNQSCCDNKIVYAVVNVLSNPLAM